MVLGGGGALAGGVVCLLKLKQTLRDQSASSGTQTALLLGGLALCIVGGAVLLSGLVVGVRAWRNARR